MARQEDIQITHLGRIEEGFSLTTTVYRQHHFPKHFHDHYTILLVEEGINEGFTEKQHYRVGPGQVLIINPGELHAGHSFNQKYLRFRSLRITASLLNQIYSGNGLEISGSVVFETLPITNALLARQITALSRGLAEGRTADEMEADYTALLFTLLERHSNKKKTGAPEPLITPALIRAERFIRNHFKEDINLPDIAAYAHLSRYHLIRQFKKKYGLSPFQYLRNLRVEEAKKLFPCAASLSQIALEVGFFDQSHFIRNFKKIEGMPPSVLRKK
jgi:AraC-like DNA-binding protein